MTACTYDPRPLLGAPMGMFHCPECGCMVLAGMEHGPCEEICWVNNPPPLVFIDGDPVIVVTPLEDAPSR